MWDIDGIILFLHRSVHTRQREKDSSLNISDEIKKKEREKEPFIFLMNWHTTPRQILINVSYLYFLGQHTITKQKKNVFVVIIKQIVIDYWTVLEEKSWLTSTYSPGRWWTVYDRLYIFSVCLLYWSIKSVMF
jgi:hypothetical protein